LIAFSSSSSEKNTTSNSVLGVITGAAAFTAVTVLGSSLSYIFNQPTPSNPTPSNPTLSNPTLSNPTLSNPTLSNPNGPSLSTYPLKAGEIYRDGSGNILYLSRDSQFPYNPEIFKITKYSAITDTFALCSIESATFVTNVAAHISAYGFVNIKKTSTGVILYERDTPDSAITLTAITTNPLQCGTLSKPVNKLKLLKSNDYSLRYYDYSLVVYDNMFVTGNIRDNVNGNNVYKSAKFSMTTGEDLGFLTISNEVIPNTYYGGSFTAIQSYDGKDFYSSCHCGGDTGLVQNSTGLMYDLSSFVFIFNSSSNHYHNIITELRLVFLLD